MSEQPRLTDPMIAYRGLARPEDVDRMTKWLGQVTYRPNTTLSIRNDQFGAALLVELEVEDTYNPGRTIHVLHRRAVMPYAWDVRERFIDWVAHALEYVEVHECREWFKWAATGKPVNDPHAND